MKTERSWAWRILQGIARPSAALLFRLQVYGREHVPARGGALLVSNHQSYLDPLLLPLWLDRPLNYIAKSELFENPLSAWLLRSVFNAFPVRQGHSDVHAIKETIHRLQEGHLLNIYPEGARSADGQIGPLRRGVALIVERTQAAVVPAVIVGAFDAWPLQRRFPRRGRVYIEFGPPMDLADLEREEIMAIIEETLRTMFAALSTRASLQAKAIV